MPDARPHGIILAGGLARRMGGGDKGLVPLAGRPMLAHVIARIRPQVARLALNANGDPTRFAAFALPVIPDTMADNPGPLAGVLAGLRWAAGEGAADLLTVPTDTPFLPPDLAARLTAGRGAAAIACASSAGQLHPVAALWRVASADALEAALRAGTRRLAHWMRDQGLAELVFATDHGDPFANINTPDERAQAEARLTAPQAQ